MKNKIPIRFPRALAATLFATWALTTAAHAAPFTLLRDTVDLRASGTLDPFDFLHNPSTDTLQVDSLSARLINSDMPMAQIVFRLRRSTDSSTLSGQSFLIQGSSGFGMMTHAGFRVAGQVTLRMVEPRFDVCIFCPTKRLATRTAFAKGDTLRAWLRFHSGADVDSVLFLSRQSGTGSALEPGMPLALPATVPARSVDAAGRSLRDAARHGLTVPKRARRAP